MPYAVPCAAAHFMWEKRALGGGGDSAGYCVLWCCADLYGWGQVQINHRLHAAVESRALAAATTTAAAAECGKSAGIWTSAGAACPSSAAAAPP